MQSTLDDHMLRHDIVKALLSQGATERTDAERYADRLVDLSEQEGEHQGLLDPFDRSVALVFALIEESGLDPWAVDLGAFVRIFSERVSASPEGLDLPACGRLIRLAWSVLRAQAEEVLHRSIVEDQEHEFFEEGWDWTEGFDEPTQVFTSRVSSGQADPELSRLFEGRVRRKEGRPVTLGELLAALKDACDDAEALKSKERNRRVREADVARWVRNVGGRMHDEDLEGDLRRTWTTIRTSGPTTTLDELRSTYERTQSDAGATECDQSTEARITTFLGALYLTHQGFTLVDQPLRDGPIHVVDRWPDIETFEEVRQRIEGERRGTAPLEGLIERSQSTGAVIDGAWLHD